MKWWSLCYIYDHSSTRMGNGVSQTAFSVYSNCNDLIFAVLFCILVFSNELQNANTGRKLTKTLNKQDIFAKHYPAPPPK